MSFRLSYGQCQSQMIDQEEWCTLYNACRESGRRAGDEFESDGKDALTAAKGAAELLPRRLFPLARREAHLPSP
jgi:hypothetical protein